MGSTTHYGVTLNEAITSELDNDVEIIARGAGGGDYSAAYGGWEGCVWMVARKPGSEPVLTSVLYTRGSRGTGYHREKNVTIKWVDESMGPGSLDVPDNVWKHRPAEAPGEYAVKWRRSVEEFRAEYPQLVRKLGPEHEGRSVYIDGHDADGPWTYLGLQRHRRTQVRVFETPEGRRFRLPATEERLRRCRVS